MTNVESKLARRAIYAMEDWFRMRERLGLLVLEGGTVAAYDAATKRVRRALDNYHTHHRVHRLCVETPGMPPSHEPWEG